MTATSKRTYYHKVSCIIENLEALEIEKIILSTTVTLQGNDVRAYLCLHCITVNNNNNNNNNFLISLLKT
jgi:isochorismate synthase EntC